MQELSAEDKLMREVLGFSNFHTTKGKKFILLCYPLKYPP